MLKYWLAFLLLIAFCLHTLPVLEPAADAYAWLVEDGCDDGCEDDGCEEPFSLLKKDAEPKWCGPAGAHPILRMHHNEKVRAALHEAAMSLPRPTREVQTPPPNCG